MAPPLPPPGVPDRAGLAPWPIAWLWVMTLLSTTQDTPMLLSAPPLEQAPPRKVSLVMYTGRLSHWDSARIAAPPRSGPAGKQRLPMNRESTTLSCPPRSKMAPPPLGPPKSSLVCWAVELPSRKVMFCTIRRGHCWLKQSELAVPSAWSQVFMYRIRRAPPPLSATIPPPSRTTRRLVLRTSAVASIVIVTGRAPQLKVITPPAATAATTACEVQLAGVPSPMTWSGWLVLTGRPAAGTNAWPAGFPAAGSRTGVGDGLGLGLGAGELDIPARATAALAAPATAAPAPVPLGDAPPHAASVTPDANATTSAVAPPLSRTRPHVRSSTGIPWLVRDRWLHTRPGRFCSRRPCRAPAASAATGTGARRSPAPGGPARPADGKGARCRRPGQRNSLSM